ncbi:hypothetical protein JCM37172_10140 [Faecalimonas hominis]
MNDKLLENAVKIAVEKDYKKEVTDFSERDSHTFPPAFEEKMQPLLHRESPIRYRKRLKFRYLLVAILVLLFGGMTVLANPDIRERIGKYFEQLFDDHTDVSFDAPENHKEKEFVKVKPTYIPEGCTLVDAEYDSTFETYSLIYEDKNERTFYYEQSSVKFFEDSSVSISSDGTPAKKIDISGFPCYLLSDEYGFHTLMYITDNYVFQVGGESSSEELIKVIKSLRKE